MELHGVRKMKVYCKECGTFRLMWAVGMLVVASKLCIKHSRGA